MKPDFFFTEISHYLYAGDTALHMAAGGSGSAHAREQQAGIIRLLMERGARPTDRDGRGKQASQAATSEWVRTLLDGAGR